MVERFWPALALILEFVVRLVFIGMLLLGRNKRPTSRVAWALVILALPLLGVPLYILVGEVRLGRRRIRRHGEIIRRINIGSTTSSSPSPPNWPELLPAHRQLAHLAELTGDCPPRGGHDLQLHGDTDLFIQSLVEDIDAATLHCHLLFYIFLSDHSGRRVAEALIAATRRGVTSRLLVDAVGSSMFLRSNLRAELEQAGVRVVEALPANPLRMLLARIDLRNHRKIVVIDGAVGYLGSHNIADAAFAIKPRFAPWVDAMVRIEGPVVRDLQTLFVQDWYLDTDESLEEVLSIWPGPGEERVPAQIVGTGPNCYHEAMREFFHTAFNLGREELILTTPYFVPDEATATALRTAARRGVDTTLLVPARNDSPLVAAASRSFYESLLQAGVHIHEYQKGLLHAKTLTIDRELAVVSTANLDRRSFELNFEVSMVVFDSDFASQLRFLQQSYLDDARPIELDAWTCRPWPTRIWQNGIGMLSPLL